MSNRDWFEEYEFNARQDGDARRAQLGRFHREAYRHRESDPDLALDLLVQGRRLAEAVREPWWELFYDQQRVHALLHFKQDYRDVLDLAVRNTLEVRKPGLAGFPRRLMVHLDLVSAYLGIDPVGHADAMRQSLDYLEAECEPLSDERYLVLGSRRQFILDLDQLDEARKLAKQSQALAAEDSDRSRACHFLVFTYSGLAEIAFRKSDMGALSDASEAGMDMARQVGHQVELAGFQLWRALVCRRQRREAQAVSLYEQAAARLNRLGMPPDASYRDAECAYHELGCNPELALAVRDRELVAIEGRGRLWYAAQVHVKRCELRERMNVLNSDDIDRASAAIAALRAPEILRERLARLSPDVGGRSS